MGPPTVEASDRLDVTVLVTVYNDHRLERAVSSVLEGDRVPEEVLIADGGSDDGTWGIAQNLEDDHEPVRALRAPGSVAETRNRALPEAVGDIVAFLDTDEVAPAHWLATLVAPIEAGEADFAGGPTRPLDEPATKVEAYVNAHDDWFYEEVVADDITMLPMGNSAWRRDVLLEIDGFDPRLRWGGEDYDVNLRAQQAGYEGVYVEDAWLHHDQGDLDSLRALLSKRYRYQVGATMAYLKSGVLGGKAKRSAGDAARFRHRYEWLVALLKPFALLSGWWRYRREIAGRSRNPS